MTKKDVASTAAKGRALTAKQQRFCDEYLIDLNATQAAIRAGYSEKTAHSIGAENLIKPEIQNYIQERQKALQVKTEITQERVLAEYAKIAFLDPRKLFNDDGTIRPITELDDDTAAAIGGIDVSTQYLSGDDDKGFTESKKIKLVDKKGALDSLARHLGMFNDRSTLDVNINPLEALMKEIAQES